MPRLLRDASLIPGFFDEAYGCLAEHCGVGCRTSRHPDFLNPPSQDQLNRFKVACASALVNFASKDLLC